MIIIPDIHGRSFWKSAVAKAERGEKIIFLGDYLDPYYREYDPLTDDVITQESALANFKEILEFKRAHADQVILLVGNHDVEYFLGTVSVRCDYDRFDEIGSLFMSNRDLFTIGYHCAIGKQPFTFSHTCITEGWAKQASDVLGQCGSPEEVIDKVNQLDEVSLGRILNQIGWSRGGHDKFGSMVWADLDEAEDLGWGKSETFQIFSHTLQASPDPVIDHRYAMLDVKRAFRLDEQLDAIWPMDRIVELEP